MPKLHEISDDFLQLQKEFEEAINSETGEIENAEKWEIVEKNILENLSKKTDSFIKHNTNAESDIKAIEEEINRLETVKKQKTNSKKHWDKYVLTCMKKMGSKQIEGSLGKIVLKSSEITIVNDKEIKFSKLYSTREKTIVVKHDKNKIKALLKEGKRIKGAYLSANEKIDYK